MSLSADIRSRAATSYSALDAQQQAVLLARLANLLVIEGRATYDLHGGVENCPRLRAVNEAQNRVLAQLLRLLLSSEERYPDNVFANILVDQFDMLNLNPTKLLSLLEQAEHKP